MPSGSSELAMLRARGSVGSMVACPSSKLVPEGSSTEIELNCSSSGSEYQTIIRSGAFSTTAPPSGVDLTWVACAATLGVGSPATNAMAIPTARISMPGLVKREVTVLVGFLAFGGVAAFASVGADAGGDDQDTEYAPDATEEDDLVPPAGVSVQQ